MKHAVSDNVPELIDPDLVLQAEREEKHQLIIP